MRSSVAALALLCVLGSSAIARADDATCAAAYCPIHQAWEACELPAQHCAAKGAGFHIVCGETLENGVCRQDTIACVAGDGTSAAAPQMDAVNEAVRELVVNGRVDSTVSAAAGVQVGMSLLQGMFDDAARARAQAALEKQRKEAAEAAERARLEAERARQREEAWKRLSAELHIAAPSGLGMHMESSGDLQLHMGGGTFDGDRGDYMSKSDTDTDSLMKMNRTSDTFGEKVDRGAPNETPVDLRRGQRAAFLARPVLYAPPEQQPMMLDEAIASIGGGAAYDGIQVPADAPALDALSLDALTRARDGERDAQRRTADAQARLDDAERRVELDRSLVDKASTNAALEKAVEAQRTSDEEALATAKHDLERAQHDATFQHELARLALWYVVAPAPAGAVPVRALATTTAGTTVALLRSTTDDSNGHPYYDCKGADARVASLQRGLESRAAVIDRERRILEGARAGKRSAELEMAKTAGEHLVQDTNAFLEDARVVRKILKTLAVVGVEQKKAHHKMKEIHEVTEVLDAAIEGWEKTKTAKEVLTSGVEVARKEHDLEETCHELRSILFETDLYDDIMESGGEKIAAAGGPFSIALFHAGTFAIDFGAAWGDKIVESRSVADAERALAVMAREYERDGEMLAEAKAVQEHCAASPTREGR